MTDLELEIQTLRADSKSKTAIVIAATGEMILFIILTIITINQRDDWMNKYLNLKKQAIELNYASYNRTNGCWQWNTNQ